MTTYVLKYNNQYCAFGSYHQVRLVKDVVKASCYSTKELASKRVGKAWVNGHEVNIQDVVEVKLKLLSEKKV